MSKAELATQEKAFNLQVLEGEIAEAIAEEMDGLGTIPYDRVKIPSGGGLAFELPGEDEDHPVSATELVGVILYHHPINAYWKEKFNGGNEQPDCASLDGKQGINKDTGVICDCATCPYNQFGSDGQGKACKNAHRVYILREGSPVPIILTLPPTSLKPLRDFIGKKILLAGKRSYQVVTKITLKKEKSAQNIVYSKAAFELAGQLDADQIKAVEAMADAIKASSKDVDNSDYDTTPATGNDGFVNVDSAIKPEELPFN